MSLASAAAAPSAADKIDANKKRQEQDALHILPLSIVPLQTPGLQRARMIKDPRLESVVELFHDAAAGSGCVPPNKLAQIFAEQTEELEADLEIIHRLATLNSYDVYTLRIELRRLEIVVNDVDSLKLSDEKNRELTEYMRSFTRPLINQIYGDANPDFNNMGDLVGLFKSPDKDKVLMNIIRMAERLQIQPPDVPSFLEEYGDVFLSLAYYRNIVDKLMVRLETFTEDMSEILDSQQIKRDPRISDTCLKLDQKFNDMASWIAGRFESFDRNSQRLWDDINADSFRKMKRLISGHYTTIGGMLCGLQVKMDAWDEKFGGGRGGPLAKADFIMADFRQGMDVISRIKKQAPEIHDIYAAGRRPGARRSQLHRVQARCGATRRSMREGVARPGGFEPPTS